MLEIGFMLLRVSQRLNTAAQAEKIYWPTPDSLMPPVPAGWSVDDQDADTWHTIGDDAPYARITLAREPDGSRKALVVQVTTERWQGEVEIKIAKIGPYSAAVIVEELLAFDER